ncbi:hypothetical protein Hanom_Chr04g00309201 [Helianthus anomalus]
MFVFRLNYKFCPLSIYFFFKRFPLAQNLTSYVLNVSNSCTVCPLSVTQIIFLVKSGHPMIF